LHDTFSTRALALDKRGDEESRASERLFSDPEDASMRGNISDYELAGSTEASKHAISPSDRDNADDKYSALIIVGFPARGRRVTRVRSTVAIEGCCEEDGILSRILSLFPIMP